MQVYLAIKYHADNANRDRIGGINAALATCGIHTICIARDVEQWGTVHFDPHTLMQKSFEAIDACDLVVVDLTEKGVGIGIEAGYAYARHIPIFTIAQVGSNISETLRGISDRVCFYNTFSDLEAYFDKYCA
jgi:nucleoside 2-deoxyribosyltransferase